MVCIYCKSKTRVTNSRSHSKRSPKTWRRRQCQQCQAVFTTHERPDYSSLYKIRRLEGDLADLLPAELVVSAYNALEGHSRPARAAYAEDIVNSTLDILVQNSGSPLIEVEALHRAMIRSLAAVDQAAAATYGLQNGLLRSKNRQLRKLLQPD